MNRITSLIIALVVFCSASAEAQTEATFYTTMGSFVVKFEDVKVPRTVDSFIARINSKFYDGILFHRVISGFMIQGGDPSGNGSGGPGYATPDEIHGSLGNVAQAVAMANAGPNTNGSQFYINLVNNPNLNGTYTVVGMVTTGFSVVQAIGQVATTGPSGNPKDKPLTDVKMDSVRINNPTNVATTSQEASIITVFPNPTQGTFTVTIPNTNNSELVITDIKGQVVYQATIANTSTAIINLGNQAKGIYVVQLTNDKGSYRCKVVVK